MDSGLRIAGMTKCAGSWPFQAGAPPVGSLGRVSGIPSRATVFPLMLRLSKHVLSTVEGHERAYCHRTANGMSSPSADAAMHYGDEGTR